jgi:LytR cell envelope-related transcriptional attenuator
MADDDAEDFEPRRPAPQVHMVRAGIVVACFLVALILLLGPAGNYSAGAPNSTTPTTQPAAPVVKHATTVQVANGTTAPNAATTFSHNLNVQGWDVLTAVDTTPAPTASTQRPTTYVYFRPMQQPAAQMVAAELTVPANHVLLRTQGSLHAVPGSGNTDVVVILGKDLTGS